MKRILRILLVLAVIAGGSCMRTSRENIRKTTEGTDSGSITDDSLMTLVQYRTFQYFYDGAEPVSGMARERYHVDGEYPGNDMNVVTSGGTGFGVMAIIVGMERGFITRAEGFAHLNKIVGFLKGADRFHGVWPHWLFGETGKVKPFSQKDNGADIVETAFLIQGLLAVRQYYKEGNAEEKLLADEIDRLWREVEWSWFTKGGEDVIYWHWSPDYGWEMNHQIRGYNECLIAYVLAASSPTYPVSPEAYHKGWARGGDIKTESGKYGYALTLKHNGAEEYGGPLFWAHYSYLGLDPRRLHDNYADYWQQNTNHSLINWKWCAGNPLNYAGYSEKCWGLTASYSVKGYSAHAPGEKRDLGVISPTAALSSMPYTPEQSIDAMKHFYYELGDKIWGKYGFYDAFSEHHNWYPQRYLAIDQGPVVVMIENYRSGLLWDLFMSCPEIRQGLNSLGFVSRQDNK
ncbi:MAG TPA: glucoamylase family protein [Bacteroidales bacterium]|nr:glucoamylase family protein [Bacteroidales bacterium]